MSERIFLSPPHMGGAERRYVEEAFDSNFVAPVGPMLEAFEADFAAYTGLPHCVALTSGTAALHLALRGVGVGAGDTVFASDLTFIGSISPIVYQNATPVFIDADPATWNMCPNTLEDALAKASNAGKLPKAVLPTDLYGQSCDIDTLRNICDRYGVPLIIDAAESVGARYQQAHAGHGARAAAFSFNGNKIITSSGGGMLASADKALIDEARFLSQQARDPAPHYEHSTYGYNYRMSNIVAAIGRGQLEVLDAHMARRRSIFDYYTQALDSMSGISFMPEAEYGECNRWLTVMLIDEAKAGISPEQLRLALEAENIEARPMWKPMHMQPVFEGAERVGGDVSERLFSQGLCLPSGSALTDAQLERICGLIRAQLRP